MSETPEDRNCWKLRLVTEQSPREEETVKRFNRRNGESLREETLDTPVSCFFNEKQGIRGASGNPMSAFGME